MLRVTAIPQIEGFLAADAFREGNNYVRFAKIMEDRRESAHIQLSEKKKELEARGEVVFIHVETGDARQILLNHSNDLDLLFVGSRGLGKIRSLLLGSTSAYLATHSKIPITIVH